MIAGCGIENTLLGPLYIHFGRSPTKRRSHYVWVIMRGSRYSGVPSGPADAIRPSTITPIRLVAFADVLLQVSFNFIQWYNCVVKPNGSSILVTITSWIWESPLRPFTALPDEHRAPSKQTKPSSGTTAMREGGSACPIGYLAATGLCFSVTVPTCRVSQDACEKRLMHPTLSTSSDA